MNTVPSEPKDDVLPLGSGGLMEPDPIWYRRTGFRFGNLIWHRAAAFLYLALALTPLCQYMFAGGTVPGWALAHPTLAIAWSLVVSLGYPVWAWKEAIAFEVWVRRLPKASVRERERAYFKVHADLAKNFWTAVLASYTAAALVGIALKK